MPWSPDGSSITTPRHFVTTTISQGCSPLVQNLQFFTLVDAHCELTYLELRPLVFLQGQLCRLILFRALNYSDMSRPTPSDLMSTVATHLNVVIAALRLLADIIQPPEDQSPSVLAPTSAPSTTAIDDHVSFYLGHLADLPDSILTYANHHLWKTGPLHRRLHHRPDRTLPLPHLSPSLLPPPSLLLISHTPPSSLPSSPLECKR